MGGLVSAKEPIIKLCRWDDKRGCHFGYHQDRNPLWWYNKTTQIKYAHSHFNTIRTFSVAEGWCPQFGWNRSVTSKAKNIAMFFPVWYQLILPIFHRITPLVPTLSQFKFQWINPKCMGNRSHESNGNTYSERIKETKKITNLLYKTV